MSASALQKSDGGMYVGWNLGGGLANPYGPYNDFLSDPNVPGALLMPMAASAFLLSVTRLIDSPY